MSERLVKVFKTNKHIFYNNFVRSFVGYSFATYGRIRPCSNIIQERRPSSLDR